MPTDYEDAFKLGKLDGDAQARRMERLSGLDSSPSVWSPSFKEPKHKPRQKKSRKSRKKSRGGFTQTIGKLFSLVFTIAAIYWLYRFLDLFGIKLF